MPADLAADARAVFAAAVAAVRADRLLDRVDLVAALGGAPRVRVLAVGKAALGLAGVADAQLGARIVEGLATVPHGYLAATPDGLPRPHRIAVREAGHPLPDAASAEVAEEALGLARRASAERTPLLALVSGGGSALWTRPNPGLSLDDLRRTNAALLRAGVPIGDVNTVRKHLSAIKGGRLAQSAFPAPVVALVLSDVVGDDLATIASGPTVADPTTVADVLAVLDRVEGVPDAVRAVLTETLEPDDARLSHAETRLLGSNAVALEAARLEAQRRGYRVEVRARDVTGEARAVGARLAQEVRDAHLGAICLLWGGETTVTVRGEGRGGRNQETALAAARVLDGAPRAVAFLSAGTDGLDGPTEAAGAVVTAQTLTACRAAGLDADGALARNASHDFFRAAAPHLPDDEGLVVIGPTHTNVMDLLIGLAR